MTSEKTAVVLFQLGGPDSLEAVEPFLRNLFLDPDIIDFPGASFARTFLARRIASRRALPIGEHYTEIGGKSPLNELTELQARALERSLHSRGVEVLVFIAMRYWHPLTDEVVRRIKAEDVKRIVLLPLYPQFSKATTYSSVNEWSRECRKQDFKTNAELICCYPHHPLYIDALVEKINETYKKFVGIAASDIDLVFSAHGVPMDFIRKGDPYKLQVEETVARVVERGGWSSPHILCYQSKVGPAKWLEPSLTGTLRMLASKGRKRLLIVPVAFVTEHIETLHEINIQARAEADHLGITHFEMMPALNDQPKFIACLAELVMNQLQGAAPRSTCHELSSRRRSEPQPLLCPWSESWRDRGT